VTNHRFLEPRATRDAIVQRDTGHGVGRCGSVAGPAVEPDTGGGCVVGLIPAARSSMDWFARDALVRRKVFCHWGPA
jgi:hypothetical protein